ncbi:MAG: hypothetical protein M1816_004989 [Peltula sp. TS41687]|nr:MAG: hypothetical protein M1816_004989 [Peltula sp. TS41687]
MFQKYVKPSIRMVADVAIFRRTFDQLTTNLFAGFDWNGVFIAGGIVCCALLKSAGNEVDSDWANCSDIDVFLYDMTEAEVTRKIYLLYQLWRKDLQGSAGSCDSLVWRTRHTLTFACDMRRPLQVILRLYKTRADVLRRFDLDCCALGYDGKDVVLSPRCVRAFETGYTRWIPALVYGHITSQRRETKLDRVGKWARRGFGIRIEGKRESRRPETKNPLFSLIGWEKSEIKLSSIDAAGNETLLDSGGSVTYQGSIGDFRDRILDYCPHPLILLPPFTDFNTWLGWPLVLGNYYPDVVPSEACKILRKIEEYPTAFLWEPVFSVGVFVNGSHQLHKLEFRRPIGAVEDITRALKALSLIRQADQNKWFFQGKHLLNCQKPWYFVRERINALDKVVLHAVAKSSPSHQTFYHPNAGLERDGCITIMQRGLLAGLNSEQDLDGVDAAQAKTEYELWVNKVEKWPKFDVLTLMRMFGVEPKERKRKKRKEVVGGTASLPCS